MDEVIEKTVERLKKRGFNAQAVANKDECRDKVLSMIPESAKVGVPGRSVTHARFSADGARIIARHSGERERDPALLVRRNFEDAQALVDAAKRAVTRCLTESERRRFFLEPQPPSWCAATGKWPYAGPE